MTDVSQPVPLVVESAAEARAAEPQEITVFVSYWRPDHAAVAQLVTALAEVGVTAKGDWLLPATAPFRDVLGDWIASTSAIVLMLTPEFLASEECAKEVARAVATGKRLAPILYRNAPVATIPQEIRSIQWIVWPEDGDLRPLAGLLREGINKDYDWEREHGWLAERYERWRQSNKRRGYSLRRDDLKQAESWLVRAGANAQLTPRPTPEIIDFVAQSRRDDKASLRILFGSIIAVLLVLLGMGGFALLQAQKRAVSERGRTEEANLKLEALGRERVAHDLAEQRKHESESNSARAAMNGRTAAINAQNTLREQLRQVEELGRQMLSQGNVTGAAPYLSRVYSQRAANANLGETDALRFMMARAAAPLAGRRNLLSDDAQGVNFIAFSDDDTKIASTLDNGDVWTWDAAAGEQRCGVAPSEKSRMIGAAFAPDGKHFLAYERLYKEPGDSDVPPQYAMHVQLMDASCRMLEEYEGDYPSTDPEDVRFEPPSFVEGGRAFYFGFMDGVFSIDDGAERRDLKKPAREPRVVADEEPKPPCAGVTQGTTWISADASLLVDQSGMIYRLPDCAWMTRLEGSTPLRAAAFSHDNRLIAAAYGDAAVLWEWKKARPSLLAHWNTGGVDAVFSNATAKTIIVRQQLTTAVLDVESGRLGPSIAMPPRPSWTLIPLSERILVEGPESSDLIDSTTGRVVANLRLDDSYVVREHSDGTTPAGWQIDPLTKRMMIQYPPQWDSGSRTVFELRDLTTGRQLSDAQTLGDRFDALAMNWRTRSLFAASLDGQNASLWISSLADWNPDYLQEEQSFASVTAAAFLPDAQTILVAVGDGTARFYNSPRKRERIRTRLSDVKDIVISRDGRFALLDNNTSAEILDLEGGRSITVCEGTTSSDRWAMSADSRLAVTVGRDAMMRIWEMKSGRLLSAMHLPDKPSAPARFSEDGTEILVQAGKFTQLWDARSESRSADAIAQQVARSLPLQLDGERLVARK